MKTGDPSASHTSDKIDGFLREGRALGGANEFCRVRRGGTTIKFQPYSLVFGEASSTLVGADGK